MREIAQIRTIAFATLRTAFPKASNAVINNALDEIALATAEAPAKTSRAIEQAPTLRGPRIPTVKAANKYLDSHQAAAFLGFAEATLRKWRCSPGAGPRHVKVRGRVRYVIADLERFAQQSPRG